MKTRKQIVTQKVNLMLERRHIEKKFINEDEDNGIPEFQTTPADEPGKYKIKFTWKNKGVNLPKDVIDDDLFSDKAFEPLKQIFNDGTEAAKVVADFINKKQYLFK